VKRIPAAVQKKAAKIKLILLDVDGVLTDGGITIDDRGVESKRFDVRDGQGITLLIRSGIKVGLLTGRYSNIVRRRAKELGVTIVYQGVQDKAEIYERIRRKIGLKDEQIAYVGDDILDLPVLRKAGLAIAVRNGWPGLRIEVDYVTETKGGMGAVREVSELVLKAQSAWEGLTRRYKQRNLAGLSCKNLAIFVPIALHVFQRMIFL
jgi:3-deoxy-D-manno-octulosonate 8-phosphate phosphatase (KDO 8-P phosphatase)